MIHRIIGSVVVLVFILVLPYWIYIPILFIAVAFFPFYWEGVLLAFLIDVFYGSGITAPPSFISPYALLALIALIIMLPLRERLRLYV